MALVISETRIATKVTLIGYDLKTLDNLSQTSQTLDKSTKLTADVFTQI